MLTEEAGDRNEGFGKCETRWGVALGCGDCGAGVPPASYFRAAETAVPQRGVTLLEQLLAASLAKRGQRSTPFQIG